jgi:hypothetical protein
MVRKINVPMESDTRPDVNLRQDYDLGHPQENPFV